jgi:hypothetical protein
MSKKIRLNEIGFLKRMVNSFLSAKADDKEDSWIDTLKKHDDELASIFGDFNDRVDKQYKDTITRLNRKGYDVKSMDRKDTDIYKALGKYMEEAIQRRISKK